MLNILNNRLVNQPQNVVIDSVTFYDEFTDTGGGGVSFLNGNVLNHMTAVIELHTFLGFENKILVFNAANDTITNGDSTNYNNFINDGWRVGMSIEVTGTASNNGTYTIAEVGARYIKTVEALDDETDASGSFYDVTPITSIDFHYNLIPNDASESYLSLVDKGMIQRFTASGLDATDTGTVVDLEITSPSTGWSTALDPTTTGATIVGDGITAHKQQFIIELDFVVTPFYTRGLFKNLLNEVAPNYLNKFICRVDAKFEAHNPDIPYTGAKSCLGITSWFDQTNNRTKPDYYVESIAYEIAGNAVDQIDIAQPTDVTIVLKSTAGTFSPGETKIATDFFFAPLSEDVYQNTETTMRQNLANDKCFGLLGDAPISEYDGTNYQCIEDYLTSYIDANTTNITFTIDLATALQAELIERGDRYYGIAITTQDKSLITTNQTDRVCVLADFREAAYNRDNPDLFELVDAAFEITMSRDPNTYNTVKGFEGDPGYAQLRFRVETAEVDDAIPTLKNVSIGIVMNKTDEIDFVIEEKKFNTQFVKRPCGIQEIDLSAERGYHTYTDDPFNTFSLQRDAANDDGTMAAYVMQYPFVLRYEDWLTMIPAGQQFQHPFYNRCETDEITQAWTSLAEDGWSIKLRFTAEVEGYDGHTTLFYGYTSVDIETVGDAGMTSVTKFYNEVGTEVKSLLTNTRTKIVTTYTGDFAGTDAEDLTAFIYADYSGSAGVLNRRVASSAYDGESDNPFEAALPDRDAVTDYSSDNLTINKLSDTTVTVETYYDDRKQQWGSVQSSLIIGQKLTYAVT
jgi:hypothetical protein